MSYPQIIVDSGGGERVKVYSDGSVVNTGKLNFSNEFDVTYDSGTDMLTVALVGGTVSAGLIDVYEDEVLVGGESKKLNFDPDDFDVADDGDFATVTANFPTVPSNLVQQLDREVNQTVSSSSAENTIFTHTIPANVLETTRGLKFEMAFDLLMNSGSPTLRIRVKFGATTLWDGVTTTFGTSSTRMPGWFEFMMGNQSANNSQGGSGYIYINNETTTGVTTGIGSIDDDEATLGVGSFAGTSSVDTTANRDFVVTIQMSVSNVAVEFRKFIATLTLL